MKHLTIQAITAAMLLAAAGCHNNNGTPPAVADTTVQQPDPIMLDTMVHDTDMAVKTSAFADSVTLSDFRKDYKVDSEAIRLKQRLLRDTASPANPPQMPVADKNRVSELMKAKSRR